MENFFGIMKSELLYAKKYTSVHSLGSMNLSPMILGNCPYDPLKKLNHWIRTNTELSARLAATGYITTQRRFTPQQVKLLYHYLGEPF